MSRYATSSARRFDSAWRATRRDACANGSGFSTTPYTMEKIAVLAPMPTARIAMTARVNAGALISDRAAYRRSEDTPVMSLAAFVASAFRRTRNRRGLGPGLFGNGHFHPLFDHAAVEQMDAALGVPRIPRIVRDHADRGAA